MLRLIKRLVRWFFRSLLKPLLSLIIRFLFHFIVCLITELISIFRALFKKQSLRALAMLLGIGAILAYFLYNEIFMVFAPAGFAVLYVAICFFHALYLTFSRRSHAGDFEFKDDDFESSFEYTGYNSQDYNGYNGYGSSAGQQYTGSAGWGDTTGQQNAAGTGSTNSQDGSWYQYQEWYRANFGQRESSGYQRNNKHNGNTGRQESTTTAKGYFTGMTNEQAKKEYHRLCRIYHPDNVKTGDEVKMKAINEEYRALGI